MMNHVMVDLETMGIESDAAIVAIGAVKFDNYGLGEEFYRAVSLESSFEAGMSLSPSTIIWWLQQEDAAREELTSRTTDLCGALSAFRDFIGRDHDSTKIWGNGAPFDNVILRNSFAAVEISPPWKFWGDRCYRTMKASYPEISIPWQGVKHNALHDAKHQAEHLIEIVKQTGITLV